MRLLLPSSAKSQTKPRSWKYVHHYLVFSITISSITALSQKQSQDGRIQEAISNLLKDYLSILSSTKTNEDSKPVCTPPSSMTCSIPIPVQRERDVKESILFMAKQSGNLDPDVGVFTSPACLSSACMLHCACPICPHACCMSSYCMSCTSPCISPCILHVLLIPVHADAARPHACCMPSDPHCISACSVHHQSSLTLLSLSEYSRGYGYGRRYEDVGL